MLSIKQLSKVFYSLILFANFFLPAMDEPSDWLKRQNARVLTILTDEILNSFDNPQLHQNSHEEELPTHAQIKKRFDDYNTAIKEDLIRHGYSTELNPGVVELPILEWKSHKYVSQEIDRFTMDQIEESCDETIKSFLNDHSRNKYKLSSLLIRGPSASGKTLIAKLIAYKTGRPFIIIPQVFFTSTYTYQRLSIYFEFARSFKNGAVLIVENLPDVSQWADTTGIDCIRHEIVDCQASINKKLSVIITCKDNIELSQNLTSRLQEFSHLNLPNKHLIFKNLEYYLSQNENINKKFLTQLANDLQNATWTDIKNGIRKSRTSAELRLLPPQLECIIEEEDIKVGFKDIIKRLKKDHWSTKIQNLIEAFNAFSSEFPAPLEI